MFLKLQNVLNLLLITKILQIYSSQNPNQSISGGKKIGPCCSRGFGQPRENNINKDCDIKRAITIIFDSAIEIVQFRKNSEALKRLHNLMEENNLLEKKSIMLRQEITDLEFKEGIIEQSEFFEVYIKKSNIFDKKIFNKELLDNFSDKNFINQKGNVLKITFQFFNHIFDIFGDIKVFMKKNKIKSYPDPCLFTVVLTAITKDKKIEEFSIYKNLLNIYLDYLERYKTEFLDIMCIYKELNNIRRDYGIKYL